MTSSALGQRSSASTSQSAENERLRKTVTELLDRVTDLQAQKAAADDALAAMREERNQARVTLELSKGETAAAVSALTVAKQAMDISDRAIAQQQKAIDSYEKAIQGSLALVDRYEKRLTVMDEKLDKANSRVIKAGMGGFIAGVLAGLVKIF